MVTPNKVDDGLAGFLTDDEIDEWRERLAEFIDAVAEDLADETGRSSDKYRPGYN